MSIKRLQAPGPDVHDYDDKSDGPSAKKPRTERADTKWNATGEQVRIAIDSMRSVIGILPELSRIIGDYAELLDIRFEKTDGVQCWPVDHASRIMRERIPSDADAKWTSLANDSFQSDQSVSILTHVDGYLSVVRASLYTGCAINTERTCVLMAPKDCVSVRIDRPLAESVRRWKIVLDALHMNIWYASVSIYEFQVAAHAGGRTTIYIQPCSSQNVSGWHPETGSKISSHPAVYGTFAVKPRDSRVVVLVESDPTGLSFSVDGASVPLHVPGDFSGYIDFSVCSDSWRMLVSFDASISFDNVYTL
jgi:hypothetical protein